MTGAAGAIGSALAQVLAERHPQLHFTLVDKDAAGLVQLSAELPGRSQALQWDLASSATLPTLWQQAVAGREAVDLLINCAGFMEVRSFASTPWELGERLLHVDLVTPLRLMNLAVIGMPARGGWIVNISSMAGRVPVRGCAYYGAAKSGLAMASQIAGLELASRSVHVLTVLPGPVRSPLEKRARGQVPDHVAVRSLPTGEPLELAQRIERALAKRRKRLVYPAVYALADAFSGLAGCFTAAVSPKPKDEP